MRVCLLAVLHRHHPDWPLIVAANRDELLRRPALAMTVLEQAGPRILGGRDLEAGGTWLAMNEHGLIAGLTNRPALGPERPVGRRTRGELPLALARHRTAEQAVEVFASTIRPAEYGPAWLLVADRTHLFSIDMEGERPRVEPLSAGLHILENVPLHSPSAKVDHVRQLLAGIEHTGPEELQARLYAMLRSHELPDKTPRGETVSQLARQAACVHADPYGTRSALIALVPPESGLPRIVYTDGPPCQSALYHGTGFWELG